MRNRRYTYSAGNDKQSNDGVAVRHHIMSPQISYRRKSFKRAGGWVLRFGQEESVDGRRKVTFFLGGEGFRMEEEDSRIGVGAGAGG